MLLGILLGAVRGMGLGLGSVMRAVPAWAWALALALLYGGWQHHRAARAGAELLAERAQVADLRERAIHDALVETTRRVTAQREIVRDATLSTTQARSAEARAVAAADRLRRRAAALAASHSSCDTAVASPGAAASSPADLLADVRGRLVEAARQLAVEATRRGIAGSACERSYDALRAR